MTLMFAYGSNLHLDKMQVRCPRAKPLGHLLLKDWRLVFRGVADCIPEKGAVCYGGVWRITPVCEEALDRYEGVSGGVYTKEYLQVKRTPNGETSMLIYCMTSTGIYPPSVAYLNIIRQGYRDFNMPREAHRILARALRESWDDKAPSHVERQRHRRNGRPTLAEVPTKGANNNA